MECSSTDLKEEMRWNAEGSIKMKKKFASSNLSYKSSINIRIFTHQNDCFATVRFLLLSNVSEKYFGCTATKPWFDIWIVYFNITHSHHFTRYTKEVRLMSVIIPQIIWFGPETVFSLAQNPKWATENNSEIRSRFSKFFPGYNPNQYTQEKKMFILGTAVSENIGIFCWLSDMVIDLGNF